MKKRLPGSDHSRERYLLALLALALTALLALIYWLATKEFGGLLVATIPNIISVTGAFVLIYFLLERRGIFLSSDARMELASHAEFERHDHVDWNAIIRSASSLDIAVFYYGSWVEDNHEAFVEFFERGGRVRLIVSDYRNEILMAAAQRHFFPRLSTTDLVKKVRGTFRALLAAFVESGTTKGAVTIHAFPELLHYSFIIAEDHDLYLSLYEQFRHPKVRAPVFHIKLNDDKEAESYWLDTRQILIDRSQRIPLTALPQP